MNRDITETSGLDTSTAGRAKRRAANRRGRSRQRAKIIAYHGAGTRTLREVGEKFEITGERVRQILLAAAVSPRRGKKRTVDNNRGQITTLAYVSPIDGMTLKEYDRYLHLRAIFLPAQARVLTLSGTNLPSLAAAKFFAEEGGAPNPVRDGEASADLTTVSASPSPPDITA